MRERIQSGPRHHFNSRAPSTLQPLEVIHLSNNSRKIRSAKISAPLYEETVGSISPHMGRARINTRQFHILLVPQPAAANWGNGWST